jgi:hypothetical protein
VQGDGLFRLPVAIEREDGFSVVKSPKAPNTKVRVIPARAVSYRSLARLDRWTVRMNKSNTSCELRMVARVIRWLLVTGYTDCYQPLALRYHPTASLQPAHRSASQHLQSTFEKNPRIRTLSYPREKKVTSKGRIADRLDTKENRPIECGSSPVRPLAHSPTTGLDGGTGASDTSHASLGSHHVSSHPSPSVDPSSDSSSPISSTFVPPISTSAHRLGRSQILCPSSSGSACKRTEHAAPFCAIRFVLKRFAVSPRTIRGSFPCALQWADGGFWIPLDSQLTSFISPKLEPLIDMIHDSPDRRSYHPQ